MIAANLYINANFVAQIYKSTCDMQNANWTTKSELMKKLS